MVGDDDLAVLAIDDAREDLPEPILLDPNRGAPAEVSLFGFPKADKTDDGVWRDFAVSRGTASGLVQLKWDDSLGSLFGQSGGAVIDKETDSLVGLLQEGSTTGAFDRYLPTHRIAKILPELSVPWCFAGSDTRAHIESRGRGRYGSQASGEFFRGRTKALARVKEWLCSIDDSDQVLVVTGKPGAGKSAVLSRIVLDDVLCGQGMRFVFHASQSSHALFCQTLARLVGVPATASGIVLTHAISERLAGRLLVLVDALDEASTPSDRHDLVNTLRGLAGLPGVRVVVATRSLSVDTFDSDGLVYRLGVMNAGSGNLVDLDREPYRDTQAVKQHAFAILTHEGIEQIRVATAAGKWYSAHTERAERVAEMIGRKASGNFLVASLEAASLIGRDEPIDPDDPEAENAIPATLEEVYDKCLDNLV